ncbi:MAG: hypothetical protein D6755_03285 [Anaerolineae bacterium]|nr:MAG: hypothetical protein D6755_03285 [Anaerolineae bacterium]
MIMDEFWPEYESYYDEEPDWDYPDYEEDYPYPEANIPETDWPAPSLSPPYLSETASWSENAPGGCFFPMLLPPVVALFFGVLFALWVLSTSPVQEAPATASLAAEQPIPPQPPAHKKGTLAPLFTEEVQYWRQDIQRWARQWNMDPNLIATVMQIESCGNPRARSRAGAMGLFQVMPYHFQAGEDPFAPEINAQRGLAYLHRALEAFSHDARLALAGYNGGIGGVSRGEANWAAETVRYAYWGSGIYDDARAGKKKSPRLNEWLQAGGASLCQQARNALGIK